MYSLATSFAISNVDTFSTPRNDSPFRLFLPGTGGSGGSNRSAILSTAPRASCGLSVSWRSFLPTHRRTQSSASARKITHSDGAPASTAISRNGRRWDRSTLHRSTTGTLPSARVERVRYSHRIRSPPRASWLTRTYLHGADSARREAKVDFPLPCRPTRRRRNGSLPRAATRCADGGVTGAEGVGGVGPLSGFVVVCGGGG
mmetsp:Transcript_28030/g.82425  ORF Transcript_28030/g.82425 Transcript_28030/m.82425 type:complete len:202 (-) Transcript_28030:129-734(-)